MNAHLSVNSEDWNGSIRHTSYDSFFKRSLQVSFSSKHNFLQAAVSASAGSTPWGVFAIAFEQSGILASVDFAVVIR